MQEIKKYLLVKENNKKEWLTQDEIKNRISKNSNIIKVGEQKNLEIYKLLSLKEISSKEKKIKQIDTKTYYLSPIMAKHDVQTTFNKIQKALIKFNVRIFISPRRRMRRLKFVTNLQDKKKEIQENLKEFFPEAKQMKENIYYINKLSNS